MNLTSSPGQAPRVYWIRRAVWSALLVEAGADEVGPATELLRYEFGVGLGSVKLG